MDALKMNKFKFVDVTEVLEQTKISKKIISQIQHFVVEISTQELPESLRPKNNGVNTIKGVFLPVDITVDNLVNSSMCRNDGKFPTLQFIHRKTGNSIWRCSEINKLMMNKEQLYDDIQFLKQLSAMTGRLVIYYQREASGKQSAPEKSYGYESRKFYKDIEKVGSIGIPADSLVCAFIFLIRFRIDC